MISLIVPAYSYGPPLERTWETFSKLCDELVIISTAFWPEDQEKMRALTPKVVQLDWNYTFKNGFGEMMNRGTVSAKNDWLMLFGVGETFEREHLPVHHTLLHGSRETIFRVDHENDPNQWTRIWNRKSRAGNKWSGLIHEEIAPGPRGPVLLRMKDTPKEPRENRYEDHTLKYVKGCLYHKNYVRLRENHHERGATDPGWLSFVAVGREAHDEWMRAHNDLISAMEIGCLSDFLDAVKRRVDAGLSPEGVNYAPTGEPMSEGSMPTPQ